MTYEFAMPDGTTASGTYTLDEKGIYTFSGNVPSYHIGGGDIMFGADGNNQLRILSIESAAGNVMGMWVGARSAEKMNTRLITLFLMQEEEPHSRRLHR